MKVGSAKQRSALGRRTQYSLKRFNVESIYFSDETIDSDVYYAETVSIAKYQKGLRICALSPDGRYNIDIEYGELERIEITDPDESAMPYEKDTDRVSNVLMGWAGGLRSLHDIKLRIGGRIEFHYKDGEIRHEVTLYHSRQTLFDLFKYIVKHFGDYVTYK